MMMVELTSVPSGALPVAELSEHLRLSSGFPDDGSQDARLEACLRSAMAAIEARVGKVLIERQFALTLLGWKNPTAHELLIAPVSTIDVVKLVDREGAETVIDSANYVLRMDTHRPCLEARTGRLPEPILGGSIEVNFTAGFGPDWANVPADLQQGMLALAADYYGSDDTSRHGLPAHVMTIIEPHRHIRLRGGAA